jgi:hypothetical protein
MSGGRAGRPRPEPEPSAAASSSAPGPDIATLIALYLFEAGAWLAVIAAYKTPVRSLLRLSPPASGIVFLVACLAVLSAITIIARRARVGAFRHRHRLAFTLALNLVPVLVVLAACELTVRLLSHATPRGLVFERTVLLPHSWREVAARNEAVLARLAAEDSHLSPDPLLGWVLGPARRSANGLYASSVEGVRSAAPGERAAGRAGRRVALVGDSFTFGLDVTYEQSWGHRLERGLGPDVQVLNFGVEAYGVDQAYLRYLRDARPWRPEVVILGIIDHDLYRSMSVYFFLSFPGWDYPFAKPRFAVASGSPKLLNAPLPSPESIAATPAIAELPFVGYEPGYRAAEWAWWPLDHSYLHRLLVSKYRDAVYESGPSRADMFALNRALVRAFVRDAEAQGAAPLVVYFPSDRNFKTLAKDPRWKSLAQTMLDESGIAYRDTTPCLAPLAPAERFPADGRNHFAPRANQAIADCLREPVRALLARR